MRVQLHGALTEAAILRTQLDDARVTAGNLAADLAAMTTDRDEWRNDQRDTSAKLLRVRQVLNSD